MKARKAGTCYECWDEIDKGEEIVMREVMPGERRPVHATHVNLPTRHVTGKRRWGGVNGTDPTQLGKGGGIRAKGTMPVVATLNRERFYLGRAHSKGQKDEMLRKFYDEHCDDRHSCHHAVHVEARGGPMTDAEKQAERSARIKAGMPGRMAS